MNTKLHKKGFTLIQMIVTCALALIMTQMFTIGANGMIGIATQNSNSTRAASLNFAMDQYRSYVSSGYTPSSGWSATNEAGVIAELHKTLSNGSSTVQILSDTQFTEAATGNGVKPSNFTTGCAWSAGD